MKSSGSATICLITAMFTPVNGSHTEHWFAAAVAEHFFLFFVDWLRLYFGIHCVGIILTQSS